MHLHLIFWPVTMIDYGSTPNPIGLFQVVLPFVFLYQFALIALGRKSINGNNFLLFLASSSIFCCPLAWWLGYWRLEDGSFSSVYFLTLPTPFIGTLFLIIARLIQPKLARGQPTVKKPLPSAVLKTLSMSLVYYIASVIILWVVFKTGFLFNSGQCHRLMCNTGQWVFGSDDKIFAYITIYALLGQTALVFPLLYIFTLFWSRPQYQDG